MKTTSHGLKLVLNISIDDKEPVPFEWLCSDELARVHNKWGERIGQNVSEHIAHNEADRKALLGV